MYPPLQCTIKNMSEWPFLLSWRGREREDSVLREREIIAFIDLGVFCAMAAGFLGCSGWDINRSVEDWTVFIAKKKPGGYFEHALWLNIEWEPCWELMITI